MPGSGMHINMSLDDQDGNNIFGDPNDENGLSKEAYYFLAGLLKHAKGLMALTNPLVNSYKRLVPGYEAPVHIAWSSINRSPLIRIPATRGTGRRIELRSPDPAGNPYLVLAACLAAGLEGLKEKKMPMPNVDKNIFEMTAAEKAAESIEELPLNLFDAVKELEADQYICDTLGKHASSKYIEAKYAEWDEYRRQITNWEIEQYLYKI